MTAEPRVGARPDRPRADLFLLVGQFAGTDRAARSGTRWGTPSPKLRGSTAVPRVPRPMPVWVAATSPPTVDLAATRGLPLLLGVHADDAAKSDTLSRYARAATLETTA